MPPPEEGASGSTVDRAHDAFAGDDVALAAQLLREEASAAAARGDRVALLEVIDVAAEMRKFADTPTRHLFDEVTAAATGFLESLPVPPAPKPGSEEPASPEAAAVEPLPERLVAAQDAFADEDLTFAGLLLREELAEIRKSRDREALLDTIAVADEMRRFAEGEARKELDAILTSAEQLVAELPEPPRQADVSDVLPAAEPTAGSAPGAAAQSSQPFGPQPTAAASPTVGGWGVAIFFFGLIGGLIGWLHLKNRDRRRADHILKWGLIWSAISIAAYVLLILTFTVWLVHSVDNSYPSYPDSQVATDYATTDATLTTPSSVALGAPVTTTTVSGTSSDDYSASAVIVAYPLEHADALPALPFSDRTALADCTVNTETDAVIPMSVTMTNTTPGFSAVLQLNMTVGSNYSYGYGSSIEGDLSFSDGSSACDGTNSREDGYVYSVIWSTPTPPQGRVTSDFFLVLHGYYTPAHPSGDPGLNGLTLAPSFSFGVQDSQTQATASRDVPVIP
jgi:hypothetical protein